MRVVKAGINNHNGFTVAPPAAPYDVLFSRYFDVWPNVGENRGVTFCYATADVGQAPEHKPLEGSSVPGSPLRASGCLMNEAAAFSALVSLPRSIQKQLLMDDVQAGAKLAEFVTELSHLGDGPVLPVLDDISAKA